MSEPAPARPPWIRVKRLDQATRELMRRSLDGLPTVCAEANCPNIGECWRRGTATFMILGDICTRGCRFCGTRTGKPLPADPAEPARLAEAAGELKLKYVVLTCVDRDDLPDSGAAHWAACIRAVRTRLPQVGVEALTGDFHAAADAVATVVRARPHVFAHNVEVVPRLQALARPQASWATSLRTLTLAREAAEREGISLLIKSGLMLGLGESLDEVREALGLLRAGGVELLTLGQYLTPYQAPGKLPVARYVTPEEFDALADDARGLGFTGVAASPLTRSSHLAETLYHTGVAEPALKGTVQM